MKCTQPSLQHGSISRSAHAAASSRCEARQFTDVRHGVFRKRQSQLHHSRCPPAAAGLSSASANSPEEEDFQQVKFPRLNSRTSRCLSRAGPSAPDQVWSLDWRAFRAQLVSREQAAADKWHVSQPGPQGTLWAHQLAAPEPGCLLVARQDNMDFFNDTVVLVLSHDEQEGSTGLVLNAPSSLRLKDIGLEKDISAAFQQELLFSGGPLARDSLHVLHGCPMVHGSCPILEGLYAGGLCHASRLVRSGDADAADFQLLAGYAAWYQGQLEDEVSSGTWWVLATSPSAILNLVQGRETQSGLRETRYRVWQDMLQLAGIEPPSCRAEHKG